MADINLLTCPFCGGNDITYFFNLVSGFICEDCGCQISGFKTYDEAVTAWNARKPMVRIVEQLEEELRLADIEKERCAREDVLQFGSAKGYAHAMSHAIEIVKGGDSDEID